MPRYVAADWRVLAYPIILMLVYLVYQLVHHKRLARQAWHVAFYALAVSVLHALIDFVPYYCLGITPPPLVRVGNGILGVVLILPVIVVLVRDLRKLNWAD